MSFDFLEKLPHTNFRNQVTTMTVTATKTVEGKTATTGASVVFGPKEIKDASYWTDEKIDEFANELAISSEFEKNLDIDLAKLATADE